jgi:hypothetical protein
MRRAMLLLPLLLPRVAPATPSSSCPVATAVSPFAATDLRRWTVEVTDGGPGDADGAADGTCTVALQTCLGATPGTSCTAAPLASVQVSVRGNLAATARRTVAADVADALATVAGARAGRGTRVDVAGDAAPSGCASTTVRLPADAHAARRLRLVLAARAGTPPRRRTTTVAVRCLAAAADPGTPAAPVCRTVDGACPPLADTAAAAAAVVAPRTVARTYFLSPSGNDRAGGTSSATAWRTFARALPVLRPGDTLVLGDGRYTRLTTGLPHVNCGAGLVRSGVAGAPITMRAAHERRAWLAADGHSDALEMSQCAWWRLVGLHASNADSPAARAWDGNVFEIIGGHDLVLSRLLAHAPNRRCPGPGGYCNSHPILNAYRVLVEESEVYDYHRHGISLFGSRWAVVRRCYVNPRGLSPVGGTGIMLYGSSDSIVENSIAESSLGINIAGTRMYDGSPGGYRNRLLGVVTLGNANGITIRARRFGGPVLPVGDNLVLAKSASVGLFARGAENTVVDHVTVWGTRYADGIAADQDAREAPCSGNPRGCSIALRNVLSFANAGPGIRVDTRVVRAWGIDASDSVANRGGNWPTREAIGDTGGNIRRSRSVVPSRRGLGAGQCLLWPAPGDAAPDAGARLLYRYQNGMLTTQRLWDRTTGAFPCGAVVAGVNDGERPACVTVHRRLNVDTNGCRFPAGY